MLHPRGVQTLLSRVKNIVVHVMLHHIRPRKTLRFLAPTSVLNPEFKY